MLTSIDLNKANGHPIGVQGGRRVSVHDGQWCSGALCGLSLFLGDENIKSSVKVYGELRVMKEKAMLQILYYHVAGIELISLDHRKTCQNPSNHFGKTRQTKTI